MAAQTDSISRALRRKADANPDSPVPIRLMVNDLSGANKESLLEEVKSVGSGYAKVGDLVNFRVEGRKVSDLPQPEGAFYDLVRRASTPTPPQNPPVEVDPMPCTQVVMEMVDPETGETRTASDGCEVDSLKEAGWVPKADYQGGNGQNGSGGDTGAQEAGFLTTGVGLAIAGSAALAIGMAASSN